MEHFISIHALEVVENVGYDTAISTGAIRLLIADEDGYDAVLTADEIAELAVAIHEGEDPTAVWQPDMRPWDPPANYRSPPREWMQ